MDASKFLRTYGDEDGGQVAIAAGTTLVYLKQIATGFRNPSPRLAKRLEEASGGRMTRDCLRPDIFGDAA
jgi:DNA-binding transcriptional regulator YdaS (Cro superfamily)